MPKHFRNTLIAALACLTIGLAAPQAATAQGETVTFMAGLESAACLAVCGACCGAYGVLEEINGGFTGIPVNGSAVTLEPYRDTDGFQRFAGYFYEGSGACDVGTCTFFFVESVDQPLPADSMLDTSAGTLLIPSLVVDEDRRFDFRWRYREAAPDLTPLPILATVPQGDDCSDPGTRCEAGTSCLPYFGIAGGSGPLFQTCEIPCRTVADCPTGQDCVTIADGPGQVCLADPEGVNGLR